MCFLGFVTFKTFLDDNNKEKKRKETRQWSENIDRRRQIVNFHLPLSPIPSRQREDKFPRKLGGAGSIYEIHQTPRYFNFPLHPLPANSRHSAKGETRRELDCNSSIKIYQPPPSLTRSYFAFPSSTLLFIPVVVPFEGGFVGRNRIDRRSHRVQQRRNLNS